MDKLGELWMPMEDVRVFHKTFGKPAPEKPTAQPVDLAKKRAGWIKDECDELVEAGGSLVDQADAYIDVMYFAFGGLVELGVDPSPLWRIVQAANMAKLWPDGEAHCAKDGKIMKPEGWAAPEPWLKAEIARQIRLADQTSIDPSDVFVISYGQDLTPLQQQVERAA
jgi:predicted HAD superfamily Cof-like phosphohydrolase